MKISLNLVTLSLFVVLGTATLSACNQKASTEDVAAQVKVELEKEKAQQAAQTAEVASEVAAQVKVALAEEKAKQVVATPVAAPEHEQAKKAAAPKHEAKVAPAAHEHAAPAATVQKQVCANCGVVVSVNMVEEAGKGSGAGGIGGALVGGLLGNQVGNGTGRDVATVVGAIGGAFAGNAIEKNAKKTKHYDIAVRMDDGVERMYHQATDPGFSGGEKVKIENDTVIRN